MAETKDDIAADRDRLAAENEQLRSQLAAVAAAGPAPAGPVPARHTFTLSEGERQELVAYGRVNKDGRSMTRDDVRAALGESQQGLDLGDAEPAPAPQVVEPTNIRGIDYVYPSVTRGGIDPAVAGTPGISGPAATDPDAGTPAPAAEDPAV